MDSVDSHAHSHTHSSYSATDTLSEREPLPEHAPRIKIGDQYFRVMRMVGGHYETPLSNASEIEKMTRIGEVFFSAHKQHVEGSELSEERIQYIDDEGIHYESGTVVNNQDVTLDPAHAARYFEASDNLSWQQPVVEFEAQLNGVPASTPINKAHLPPFLQGQTKNPGPFTTSQVKELLMDYTREKLITAYEVYAAIQPTHYQQEHQREADKKAIDDTIDLHNGSATHVIRQCNDYLLKAPYLKADNLWKMMTRSLQPEELRLIPEEEGLFLGSEALSSDRSTPSPFLGPEALQLPPHLELADVESVSSSTPRSSPDFVRMTGLDRAPSDSPIHTPVSLTDHLRETPSPLLRPTPESVSSPQSPSAGPGLHNPSPRIKASPHSAFRAPVSRSESPVQAEQPPRSATPASTADEWVEIPLTPSASPSPSVVVPFNSPQSHRSSPIPRTARVRAHAHGTQRGKRPLAWDRTYLDRQEFQVMGQTYRDLEIAVGRAASNDWSDARESKQLCGAALNKLQADVPEQLTDQELSVIKRLIELREQNRFDPGAFRRLPTSERYRAIVHDLQRLTAPRAMPLSKKR